MDADAALLYLDFVEERHRVWYKRQLGEPQPWTDDPILATYKFTNVFRILDPGSQFVLTDLAGDDPSPEDLLMRLFLYRHTGRVEVWKYLQAQMGGYPTTEDLDDVLDVFKEYRGDAHVRTRTVDPRNAGRKTQTDFKRSVFTSAYLVFPQSQVPGTDKLESIIHLTARLFCDGRFDGRSIVPDFLRATSQAERFGVLRRNKGVADFMSMQILTDWGYTQFGGDYEDEFVVAGPGAIKGAAALGMKANDAIEWAVKAMRSSPRCPRIFRQEGVCRVPSYMDAQNTLCEFSKYVRYVEKPPKATIYTPAHPGRQKTPVFPWHW